MIHIIYVIYDSYRNKKHDQSAIIKGITVSYITYAPLHAILPYSSLVIFIRIT